MDKDLSLLIDAARASGEIASRFFNQTPEVWDKPDGAGPVTEADIAVDNMLRQDLISARPDYGWLSEETEDNTDRLDVQKVFIIDPIDGTRAYIEGNPTWAHSLAIAKAGRVTHAVVYLPERDKMYVAQKGKGATLNDQPIKASTNDEVTGATVLAAKPAFDPWVWLNGKTPNIKREFRSSLAYRMSLVGEGRFDAMMTLRATWEWDVAAGTLIIEEAGGVVSDRLLKPLQFNNPNAQVNGVFAGGRGIHQKLGACLSFA